jgi:non-ribosomal peptide synthetase component F
LSSVCVNWVGIFNGDSKFFLDYLNLLCGRFYYTFVVSVDEETTMNRPWLNAYDPGVPHELEYPDFPLTGLLKQTAEAYPKKSAIHFFNYHLNYKELLDKVYLMSLGLKELGVKKGDRVGIMLPKRLTVVGIVCSEHAIAATLEHDTACRRQHAAIEGGR